MAGMTVNESLISPELRAFYVDRGKSVPVEHLTAAAHKAADMRRGRPLPMTQAGRRKISDTSKRTWDGKTPEDRAEQERRRYSALNTPEARARQGESLRKRHQEDPKFSAAVVERLNSNPELAKSRAAEATARRRLGHGTVANYDHRGCRCDACRAAKAASRKKNVA